MAIRVRRVKMNPGWRKPVDEITDRAKRYRANHPEFKPTGKTCFLCGDKPAKLDVHHIDGDESNGEPDNLVNSCRSCNVWLANRYRELGLGKLTRQFNPGKKQSRGAKSDAQMLREYHASVMVMRGFWPGDSAAAHDAVLRFPSWVRSAYTREAWRIRKDRYGPSGRKDGGSVPF